MSFPITEVTIDWDRLIDKRPLLLETLDIMPKYLLKPGVLTLLEAERHPMHRLILDLMWCTDARVSEVLAITPANFHDDGCDFGVVLKTLKQGAGGRASAASNACPSGLSRSSTGTFRPGSRATCGWGSFEKTSGSYRSRVRRSAPTLIG